MARLTLEELTDRFEIDALFDAYVTALDDDRFDELGDVFTEDATIGYPDVGMSGDYPTIAEWLARARSQQQVWLHLVGNRRVRLDGDRATAVSTFFFTGVGHEGNTYFTGGEYHDQLVRTAEGWRISERLERNLWRYGDLPSPPE
jgi:3-phenylpropionate/cinnamic acid dioxygenase small subunit